LSWPQLRENPARAVSTVVAHSPIGKAGASALPLATLPAWSGGARQEKIQVLLQLHTSGMWYIIWRSFTARPSPFLKALNLC
jgi:hypothetical protein